jgi:hypothetical protein
MKEKQQNHIDLTKQTFFINNNIDLSLIKELNKCVSNDLRCNEIKKIINEKVEKLITLNETLNKPNETDKGSNNYISNEFTKQIESFNKLILLGHKILV